MCSCKTNLQFFLAPLMCFTSTGQSNQHRSSSTNYLQFVDSLFATCIFLTGQQTSNVLLGCISHMVSVVAEHGANVFPVIVYADFETSIYKAVTTVWAGCEVKACRFHLGHSWRRKIQTWDSASGMGRKTLR